MRKVVAYMLVSLDGVAEDPDQFLFEFDDVMEANLAEVIGTQDTVLLGRATYDEWADFWPKSDIQPFADFINGVRKYVVTSRPLSGGWAPAEAVSGPLEEVVARAKASTDADVGVHASITLAQSLLAEGLVDELCLAVGRVLDPVGPRLFAGLPDLRELELLEAAPTSTGSVWLRYRCRT